MGFRIFWAWSWWSNIGNQSEIDLTISDDDKQMYDESNINQMYCLLECYPSFLMFIIDNRLCVYININK